MKFNPEEFTETQQKLFDTLKFMSKLLLAGAVFQTILYIYPDTRFLQSALAELISGMLDSTGKDTVVQVTSVYTGQAQYIITQDCLGWKSAAAFIALIYASTERTLEHLNIILQGVAVIILANIVRVYTTVVLAERGIISFNIIHDVLWSWSLTLLVLVMWVYWLRELKDREPIYQQRIKERVSKLKEE